MTFSEPVNAKEKHSLEFKSLDMLNVEHTNIILLPNSLPIQVWDDSDVDARERRIEFLRKWLDF